jgi:hypothetical protein
MSKLKLKKHLKELSKGQLEEQIIELYDKFKPVKTYFNFAFNPKEDKLLEDAKIKISKEYFPTTKRRAKLRRSTATKLIKHFQDLGMSPDIIADLMCYAIEIVLVYTERRTIKNDNFFVGIFRQYQEVVAFTSRNNLRIYEERLTEIAEKTWEQDWFNKSSFQDFCP